MQRFFISLLVMMLYLLSSNSSAQQFESFRQVGEANGIAAGTVTSITLAPESSQISYFNAAGLSTIYDVALTPSQIIRESMPVYMPASDFGGSEASMNLDNVSFFTGTLVNPQDPEGNVPPHWFRITHHNGIWSGAFRIADRIYSIDRSQRDNVVEFRDTPSQNDRLQPTRQVKVTALLDEEFVFADSPGDSIGMDSLGHIHALESLHVMEGVMNDSLGITLTLDQLVYQQSSELLSPDTWLESNATSFGIEDNYASFIFRGGPAADAGSNYVVLSKLDFHQLMTAHQFGKLLGVAEENSTLQSSQNPLDSAHWSDSQKTDLLANLPDTPLIRTISSDAPNIEVTQPEVINEIPQYILDSEIVESDVDQTTETTGATDTNLLQNDEIDSGLTTNLSDNGDSGGGQINPYTLFGVLLFCLLTRRRSTRMI